MSMIFLITYTRGGSMAKWLIYNECSAEFGSSPVPTTS